MRYSTCLSGTAQPGLLWVLCNWVSGNHGDQHHQMLREIRNTALILLSGGCYHRAISENEWGEVVLTGLPSGCIQGLLFLGPLLRNSENLLDHLGCSLCCSWDSPVGSGRVATFLPIFLIHSLSVFISAITTIIIILLVKKLGTVANNVEIPLCRDHHHHHQLVVFP